MVRGNPQVAHQDITQEILSQRERESLAIRQELAEAIHAYREANGLSINKLAERIGVPSSVISRAERGIPTSISSRHKIQEAISITNVSGSTIVDFSNPQTVPGGR